MCVFTHVHMCEDVMNTEVEVNVECLLWYLSGSLTEATCGAHQVSLHSQLPQGFPHVLLSAGAQATYMLA